MNNLEALLRDKIGLDCAAIGPSTIQRVARRRMKALQLDDPELYSRHVKNSFAEYEELLDAVVVKETWFFRDPESFASMTRLAMEQWLPRNATGEMRILSLPCSSGEEAYSMAMALMDAGMPPERFWIDAMDISGKALARGQRGIYGKNAFRGRDLGFRDRHFCQEGEDFIISQRVRRKVHFTQGNLLGPEFTTPHATYDIIFFRNLLIYLHPEAQIRALQRIDRLLSPSGLLFVGPAEQPIVLDEGFISAERPLSFACVRQSNRRSVPTKNDSGPPSFKTAEPTQSVLDRANQGSGGADLLEARRLADAGHLSEAAAICEAYLHKSRFSAQAYYLLGLVRDARGEPEAAEYYRKALYLEPAHYETLVQLAVLAQQKGDLEGARHFQRRAQRLQPKQGPKS